MESFRFRSWKYFSLGWWNALASAWFPDVRHFENLTPWIQLRIGLRDRAWKPTNGHSRKLAQLSMTIFLKFWSRDHYPICIHGSRSRCFTCIAEQVTSGSCWHVFSGRAGLSFREHKRRNGEICPCSCQLRRQCFINPWIQTALFLIIAIAATSAAVSWQFAWWISLIPPRLYSTAVNKIQQSMVSAMRSNVLAGINSCFNYELQRFGAAFIRQNWDALISPMTHVVWKWAKTHPSRTLPL